MLPLGDCSCNATQHLARAGTRIGMERGLGGGRGQFVRNLGENVLPDPGAGFATRDEKEKE